MDWNALGGPLELNSYERTVLLKKSERRACPLPSSGSDCAPDLIYPHWHQANLVADRFSEAADLALYRPAR